jgi:hypothetical protein
MKPIGVFGPPAIIFPRKFKKIVLFKDVPEGIYPMLPLSVCTNSDLFSAWLKHFTNHVKPMEDDKVPFILDNHISHCNLEVVIFCTAHCITLLSLTSTLQS